MLIIVQSINETNKEAKQTNKHPTFLSADRKLYYGENALRRFFSIKTAPMLVTDNHRASLRRRVYPHGAHIAGGLVPQRTPEPMTGCRNPPREAGRQRPVTRGR